MKGRGPRGLGAQGSGSPRHGLIKHGAGKLYLSPGDFDDIDTLTVEVDTSDGTGTVVVPRLELLNGPKFLHLQHVAGAASTDPVALDVDGGGYLASPSSGTNVALPQTAIGDTHHALILYLPPDGNVVRVASTTY